MAVVDCSQDGLPIDACCDEGIHDVLIILMMGVGKGGFTPNFKFCVFCKLPY